MTFAQLENSKCWSCCSINDIETLQVLTWLHSCHNNNFLQQKEVRGIHFQQWCVICSGCQWFSKYLFKAKLCQRGKGIPSTRNAVSLSFAATTKKESTKVTSHHENSRLCFYNWPSSRFFLSSNDSWWSVISSNDSWWRFILVNFILLDQTIFLLVDTLHTREAISSLFSLCTHQLIHAVQEMMDDVSKRTQICLTLPTDKVFI